MCREQEIPLVARALPRTPLEELTALPHAPAGGDGGTLPFLKSPTSAVGFSVNANSFLSIRWNTAITLLGKITQ